MDLGGGRGGGGCLLLEVLCCYVIHHLLVVVQTLSYLFLSVYEWTLLQLSPSLSLLSHCLSCLFSINLQRDVSIGLHTPWISRLAHAFLLRNTKRTDIHSLLVFVWLGKRELHVSLSVCVSP